MCVCVQQTDGVLRIWGSIRIRERRSKVFCKWLKEMITYSFGLFKGVNKAGEGLGEGKG